MKKINWNIPAIVYMFMMIYMCFENLIPHDLSRMGFINFCFFHLKPWYQSWFGLEVRTIFFWTVVGAYLVSVAMIIIKRNKFFYIVPIGVAVVDIVINAILMVWRADACCIFLFKVSGLLCMLLSCKQGVDKWAEQ